MGEAAAHRTAAAVADHHLPATGASARRAGPVDSRLLRYTAGTRRFLVATVATGGVTALLVLAQAWLLASVISGAVVDHHTLHDERRALALLLAVILGRAVLSWLAERTADRASAAAKSDLRGALVDTIGRLGPRGIDADSTGRLTVLATTGIDALDAYFARYLPQLCLAVIVPVAVVLVVLGADWVSAVLIAVTVPLIPVFMSLVGGATRVRMARQARLLHRLAGHFLDVVAGLPTLRVFGRAKAQADAIHEITNRYRLATMATLKVAFLSSLILELLATISVALVAVSVGLRLLGGHLTFATALFVLILAPEAYLPLRRLAASHHASAEGVQAAADVFEVLERTGPARRTRTDVPDVARSVVEVRGVTVRYEGRPVAALHDVSLVVEPGETVALAGPNGAGKSTLLAVLLGFVEPSSGSVIVGGAALGDLDADAWRREVAWVPQRPHLFARSVADNVRLGLASASDDAVAAALDDAGLAAVVARLPHGAATLLGHRGAGLSAGERQRVALARAFLRDAPLLLLDEPTAGLDGATERGVLDAVARLTAGRTTIIAAHRGSLLDFADRVVALPARVEPAS